MTREDEINALAEKFDYILITGSKHAATIAYEHFEPQIERWKKTADELKSVIVAGIDKNYPEQLAEKDKEIERLNALLHAAKPSGT